MARERYDVDNCRQCMEDFFKTNQYGSFPYWRCKRCPIGQLCYQEDDKKDWHYDCLKRD